MPAIRFDTFVTEVLNLYKPPERGIATYRKMRQVLGELQALNLKTTRAFDDQAVIRWKAAHPERSTWTVRSLLLSIRAAANIALTKKYIRFSPFDVRPLEQWVQLEDPGCVRHHALTTIGVVLSHLARRSTESWQEHRLYALAATVAYTGVRAGEAQHAWVEDFRLDDGILEISPRRRKKTRASAQPVPLPRDLATILQAWLPLAQSTFAFPGSRRTSAWVQGSPGYKPLDKLKAAALEVGVRGFTFQSLRHSWATHAEGPWKLTDPEIQRNLRHTTIRTSKLHYRHADVANLKLIGEQVSIPLAG